MNAICIKFRFIILVVAPCCTTWADTCYTTSDVQNNNHACNQCSNDPCETACTGDASSDECKNCCMAADHAIPWNCPGTYTI